MAARQGFPSLERGQSERAACPEPGAYGVHLPPWDCRSLAPVVGEQAGVEAIPYPTVARLVAAARLQPPRSRSWKPAPIDAEVTQRAAKILWRDERVEWLSQRGEVVIGLDEKPTIPALSRCAPKQPLRAGRSERREFEYERHGTTPFLVSFNVVDGTLWGCCLERNDHEHFLWGVRQVARRSRPARRLHLIRDKGSSPIDQHTHAYFAAPPRFRVRFPPAHASWLHPAELLVRAFSDKSLDRFDCRSRHELINPLNASGPEDTRSFAHPLSWSWTRRHMYEWAEHRGASISSKTYATVH